MTVHLDQHQIHINRTDGSAAERVCLIYLLSMQRYGQNKKDLSAIKQDAALKHHEFRFALETPDIMTYIAHAPTHEREAFQDIGSLELSDISTTPGQLLLSDIRTVPLSPYPTGSALLGFTLQKALEGPYKSVAATTIYKESAEWFAKRGLFEPGRLGGMILMRRNFDKALKHITKTTNLRFE